MRFLVTGASGFIGYRLSLKLGEEYVREKIQLMVPGFDVQEKEERRRRSLEKSGFDIITHDILEGPPDIPGIKDFDVLFHLAAFCETETDSPRVHTNDVGTGRLLKSLAPRLPGKLVVYTGSMAGIDRRRPDNSPQDENYPCRPRTVYGQTKLQGEKVLRDFAERGGFRWIILRLPTVYGPGYRTGGMFDLIADSLEKGTLPARLAWQGRMSVIYIEDVVEMLVSLGTGKVEANTLYHIGSGEDPTLDDLIEGTAEVLGTKRRRISLSPLFWRMIRWVVWLPGLMSVLPFKMKIFLWRISLIVTDGMVADGSKIDRVLPRRYTPLREGLPATYNKKPKSVKKNG